MSDLLKKLWCLLTFKCLLEVKADRLKVPQDSSQLWAELLDSRGGVAEEVLSHGSKSLSKFHTEARESIYSADEFVVNCECCCV